LKIKFLTKWVEGEKMKKTLAIVLSSVVTASLLAGCGAKTTPSASTGNETKPATTTPAASASGIAKIGLGHITSIGSSKDLGVDKDNKEVLPLGQVDTVMAAVAFDKDGKVVKVTIDNAQTKVEFNKDLTLKSDVKAAGKTKLELKEAYGMVVASAIKKEWYQQAEALGKWMEGKTVADIKAMKTVKKDDAHPAVPDIAELKSSVTVSVQDYIAAVEEASKNAVEVKGAEKIGLGHNVSIASSKALGKDKDGKEILPLAQVETVMAVTAFDKDGKVVKAIIDNAQTKVNFDNTGKVTSDKKAEQKTKVELKEAYGMVVASTIKKEWYQQAEALGKWMEGKTIADIKGMKTMKKDDAHPAVPDVAELKSSVTVSVQDYLAAVEESSQNAK
jgi:roadblock/LC7 domain-containing protein